MDIIFYLLILLQDPLNYYNIFHCTFSSFIQFVLYKLYKTFTLVGQLKTWCSFNRYYCFGNILFYFNSFITYLLFHPVTTSSTVTVQWNIYYNSSTVIYYMIWYFTLIKMATHKSVYIWQCNKDYLIPTIMARFNKHNGKRKSDC